jgi:predicted DCC family thiol-disulfide oxidoreductase YuxK
MPARARVYYDEDCGFCRWAADRIRSRAPDAVEIVAIQSEHGQMLLRRVPTQGRLGSMHAVTPDGRVWSAGAGLAQILGALPHGRAPATVARRFPGLTERLYRAVANRRETLGRILGEQACNIRSGSTDR